MTKTTASTGAANTTISKVLIRAVLSLRLAALRTFTQPSREQADGNYKNDRSHRRSKYHDFQSAHSRSLPSKAKPSKCRQPPRTKQPSTGANITAPLNGSADRP